VSLNLLRYLRRHSLCFHFGMALGLGLFVRLLSAWFVYGPQALDDYKHGVWPAYQYFVNVPLDLPDYRSYLLIWLLSGFLKVGSLFGISSALAQVRTMYAGLAFLSLLGIYGVYKYAELFRSRIFGGLALYLIAIYPLMPFVSTRAFGESVALPFVVLGFALCEVGRRKNNYDKMAIGFFILGVGALFRFQVGVISVFYFGFLIFSKQWRFVFLCTMSGIALIASQALIDIYSGKYAFQTLKAYMDANAGGAAQYGASPWFNTWILVFAFLLFPFSAAFLPKLKYTVTRHAPLLGALIFFVTIHSAIPHKEERFMYPILGLLLILLADSWALSRHVRSAQRIFQPVFFIVLVLILPIACFVNTQAGEIEPAARAEQNFGAVAYLDHESLFAKSLIQFYFLRPPGQIFEVDEGGLRLERAAEILAENPALKGVEILTSNPASFETLRSLGGQARDKIKCGETQEATSLVDRLLFRLNPKHNQRRRPSLYILCERR
jgi:hypothetical protein